MILSAQFQIYRVVHCAISFYRAILCIRGTSHGPVSARLFVRPSVRLSVCPSQVGVLLKRLKSRITQNNTTR